MSPCRYSCTSFERCWATRAKPSASNTGVEHAWFGRAEFDEFEAVEPHRIVEEIGHDEYPPEG